MTILGEHVSAADLILNGILGLACIAVLISLIAVHRKNGPWTNFNLVTMLVNKEGFIDGAKCFEVGVFALMSWAFVVQITKDALQEWFLITYVGAFVGRAAYGAYLRTKGHEEPGTVTTTNVTTTARTKEVKPLE